MRAGVLAVFVLCGSAGFAQTVRPPATATSESTRLAAEYFVQRAGAAWVYQLGEGKDVRKGRVSITGVVDWKVQVSIALGRWAGGTVWRVKDGAWLERSGLRFEHETVVLPAQMTRGTRWEAPATIERGTRSTSLFEVVALDAQVQLPTGLTVDQCLAVLETPPEGGAGITHYYAPNIGKVAAQGPDGWLYRLTEFRSGARGHGE